MIEGDWLGVSKQQIGRIAEYFARAEFTRLGHNVYEQTPWHKDDWPYPVQRWTGACGVNEAAIDEWFPDLANGS
jgi:hypothetical protein